MKSWTDPLSMSQLFVDGSLDEQDNPTYGDERQYLTWGGRFSAISFAINYFSSGEEVLRNASGSIPTLVGQVMGKGPDSWTFQEMRKGTLGLHSYGLSPAHGGWGFSMYNDYLDGYLQALPPWTMNAQDSGGNWVFPDEQLRLQPFFRPFNQQSDPPNFYNGHALFAPLGDEMAIIMARFPLTQYMLLAEAIPARSFAAGANAINAFSPPDQANRNFDMQLDYQISGEWPAERLSDDPSGPWQHSDLKDIAYPYVYRFFDQMVKTGNLK